MSNFIYPMLYSFQFNNPDLSLKRKIQIDGKGYALYVISDKDTIQYYKDKTQFIFCDYLLNLSKLWEFITKEADKHATYLRIFFK